MSYTDSSLAIIEYKLNELQSQRKFIDKRINELIVIRDKIIEAKSKEYEHIE